MLAFSFQSNNMKSCFHFLGSTKFPTNQVAKNLLQKNLQLESYRYCDPKLNCQVQLRSSGSVTLLCAEILINVRGKTMQLPWHLRLVPTIYKVAWQLVTKSHQPHVSPDSLLRFPMFKILFSLLLWEFPMFLLRPYGPVKPKTTPSINKINSASRNFNTQVSLFWIFLMYYSLLHYP